jgi:hypothetical protein
MFRLAEILKEAIDSGFTNQIKKIYVGTMWVEKLI